MVDRSAAAPERWHESPGHDRAATIAELLAELDPDGTIRVRRRVKAEADAKPRPTTTTRPDAPGADGLPPLYRRIERASKYLKRVPDAIDGGGGSKVTFNAARVLVHGFCLDEGTAFDLLWTEYNPRCQGPWSERELRHKVHDAAAKPFNKPRGWLLNTGRPERPKPARPTPAAAIADPAPPAPPRPEPDGHPQPAVATATAADRPVIVQQPAELHEVVTEGINALVAVNEPPNLFVHGDSLVSLAPNQDQRIEPLTFSQLQVRLSAAAKWVTEKELKGGEVVRQDRYPDAQVVKAISEHKGGWGRLPKLNAVVNVPVFTRASGLLTRPGFDPASGVYLLESGHYEVDPVPDRPTSKDVTRALDLILSELLGDFPFRDQASRANTLALFLLPFVRDLIDGPTPLHHIDAPQEGTGKSLLGEAWAAATLGLPLESLPEPPKGDWEKTTLSAVMECPQYIFFDNLNRTLDSGFLAAALTQPVIKGRLLGFNRIVRAPVRNVWLSTANNLTMSRELVRRTVGIGLLANQRHAYQKRTFRHRLPTWAFKQHGKLVWACLVLCQAWVAEGMAPGRELLGKFESWSATMDGILQTVGVRDLLGNMDEFRAGVVDDQDDWDAFVAAWWEAHRGAWVTVRDLFPLAQADDMLSHARGSGNDESQRSRLGHAIKKKRDAVFADGLQIVAPPTSEAGKQSNRVAKYRLQQIGDPAIGRPSLELDIPD